MTLEPEARPRELAGLALGTGLVAGLLESASQFIRRGCCEGMLPLGWYTLWMPAVANAAFFLLVGALLALLAVARPTLVTLRRALLLFLFLAAAAALRVLDDPALASRLRVAGQEDVQRYSWAAVKGELLAAYIAALQYDRRATQSAIGVH